MKADKLVEIARFVEPSDIVIVECDGYELEPYAVEVNEMDGTLVIKCYSPNDDAETGDDIPWVTEDKNFQDSEVCALPEKPAEVLTLDDLEPKEG